MVCYRLPVCVPAGVFFSYFGRLGMNHIPAAEQTTTVDTPVFDPSLAALLVALDFPLVRPRFSVKKIDLESRHREQTSEADSWVFGTQSPTHGNISAVLNEFRLPLPRHETNLSAVRLGKLALHNRRVLKLAATQRLPLHVVNGPAFSKFSSWPVAESTPVPTDTASILPRVPNTDLVAIATALGHRVASFAIFGDQLSVILQASPSALYPLAEIEARFRDRDYIRSHSDPLAILSAAVLSFKPLFDASKQGGDMFVVHKAGRYATMPKNATAAEQAEIARHLST